jgi:hypothetical protein
MTTSTDTKLAWSAVADHLEALGLKLKLHVEQAAHGQQPAEEIGNAFERLGSAIESTFSAIGAAVEDSAVREDARKLAVALGDALADTLATAGQDVAKAAEGLRCGADRSEDAGG